MFIFLRLVLNFYLCEVWLNRNFSLIYIYIQTSNLFKYELCSVHSILNTKILWNMRATLYPCWSFLSLPSEKISRQIAKSEKKVNMYKKKTIEILTIGKWFVCVPTQSVIIVVNARTKCYPMVVSCKASVLFCFGLCTA